MTIKVYYRASAWDKPTYLETINVASARSKMNDDDFDDFLEVKFSEINERHSFRRWLVVHLCHQEQILTDYGNIAQKKAEVRRMNQQSA